jgi:hypothetical protein
MRVVNPGNHPKLLASPDRTGMMLANAAGFYNRRFLLLIINYIINYIQDEIFQCGLLLKPPVVSADA